MLRTCRRYLVSCTRTLHTEAAEQPATTAAVLGLLRAQPSHYVVATFAGRRYVLSPRDMLTVPRLKDVNVGDVVSLSEIHEVGSREYTLRGEPRLAREQVEVEATVVEHTKGKMEVKHKKKRRKGYEKRIEHKQTYTRLRIGDIVIGSA